LPESRHLRDNGLHPPIRSVDLVSLEGGGMQVSLEVGPVILTCNQQEPRPVVGVVSAVNKLDLLAPYIALAGLIAAVTMVVVARRRRD
jgi:hypothetical protein